MKRVSRLFGLSAFALSLCAITSNAAWAADAMADMTFINPGEMKWGDVPPVLPKGGKIAVLAGDPFKAGPYVMRLMMPAGYKIAPHWHTLAENLTVISGSFTLYSGDTMDPANAHVLQPGGFHHLPAKAHHAASTKSRTILQIHGEGPFDITYLNPADDPSKAK